MENIRKPATLKDIAYKLGISANTVSKALNQKPGVNSETIRKVLDTARELNYIPNQVAKGLRLSNTGTIGVIVSDSSYSVVAGIIKGIEEKASEMGYSIILSNTNRDAEKERNSVRILAGRRIDGIILVATLLTGAEDVDFIKSFGLPFVFLMRRSEVSNVDYVMNNNILGAYMMTSHFLENGFKKLHYINLNENRNIGFERLQGYIKAFTKLGMTPDPKLIYNAEPNCDEGYLIMKSLLDKQAPVEAVLCGCDVIAIGVMEAILEKGLSIPGDIKVAGYDDIDYAANLRVPLTTVSQPKYEMGCIGAELLINKIKGKSEKVEHIILKPELVIRKSG